MNRILTTLCMALAIAFLAQAENMYKLAVYPVKGEWNAKTGEKVKFNVRFTRCDVPMGDFELNYEVSEDMMQPLKKGTVRLHDGVATIEGGTMDKPGFLRCRVSARYDGNEYAGMGTIGFEPERLMPVTRQPGDFKEFWDSVLTSARKWALEPMMVLVPEKCTPKVNVYHVSWINDGWSSRMYGMLTVPVGDGKYPAILKLPGAGVRAYNGDVSHAERGVIVLEIGVHGIPVNLPGQVYNDLYNGALKGYHSFNIDDRERYYYKRVISGCVRGIDFIEQLPCFNGCLATFGGSQGGGLSVIVAGIDDRVDGLVSYYPAMSDMAGYTANRAGGWPHTLKDKKYHTPEVINTLAYYDVTSFAREISVPGFYTFGYNDMVCPPTTTYSVYNVINAPKQLVVAETTGHYAYDDQGRSAWQWVIDFLKQCSK